MLRNFNFDYDPDNDSLFVYDPSSKSKASVEMNDLIIDFNNRKEISGIELLNASKLLKELGTEKLEPLKGLKECKVEIISKNNFYIIKFILVFQSKSQVISPFIIPTVNESSPALA